MLGAECRFLSALEEGSLLHPQLYLFSIHLVLGFCFLIKTNVAETCCVAEPDFELLVLCISAPQQNFKDRVCLSGSGWIESARSSERL